MVTTAVAFGASINSPISTIRQYAAFQTLCVVADYVVIIFIFVPALVAWRGSIFRTRHDSTDGPIPREPHLEVGRGNATKRRVMGYCSIGVLLSPLQLALAPSRAAFWVRLAPAVSRARHPLLLGWAVIIAVQSYSCTRLQPTNAAPTIFDLDHNLERRVHLRRCAYARFELGPPMTRGHQCFPTPAMFCGVPSRAVWILAARRCLCRGRCHPLRSGARRRTPR